jgi:hypothetical protein
MLRILIFLLLTLTTKAFSQNSVDTLAVKKQLELIFNRDQKTRTSSDSADYRPYIDSCNLAAIEILIEKYGWMGRSFVGEQGNSTVFLVIQHADLATQLKYFPLLEESVKKGESHLSNMALMKDRILMRQDKKQIYGSQVVFNKETGAQEFYPIEDEINVNKRRYEIGMQPLEDYAKLFGIEYKLPVKN